MIIDIHVHSQPKRNMPTPQGNPWFATPWELIDAYDHGGVDKAVLLPCTNPENVHMVQSNEEVIGIWEDYPDRFIPFCNIDPRQCFRTPDADLGYMMSWYKDLGCRGIGEVCANLYFDDPLVVNLFDHAEKTGLPLTFHVATRQGNIYGLVDDLGLPRFEQQIQKHPDLIWLCHSQSWWSHISGDVTEETWGGYPKGPVTEGGRCVELIRKYPTVYGDLSAGSGFNAVSRDPDFGYCFLEECQDQLCYGTDICSPKNAFAFFDEGLLKFLKDGFAAGKLSQRAFDKITCENAQRILNL